MNETRGGPLLQDYVDAHAARRPKATAIVMGSTKISYLDLAEESNRLARTLRDVGCRNGDRVCFLTDKSPTAYVAILAILKAGCLYVPLDPSSPAARLGHVVDASEPDWILAAGPVQATVMDLLARPGDRRRPRIGWLDAAAEAQGFVPDFTTEDVRSRAADHVGSGSHPDDPAHILFTSGSTGVPKGVVITHANVVHFLRWAIGYFGMSEGDRNSGHSPLHFDLSTFDTFGTFACGGTLYPVPPELNLSPVRLTEFIRTSRLTQWFSVPSVLALLAAFDAVADNDFPDLRRVIWCGDVLPVPSLRYWMGRLPTVTFTNLYGPTETTIASSYYRIPGRPPTDVETIPIGRACDGEELLVLDGDGALAAPGQVGDLYIGGVGLSPGYWRDDEKSASAFQAHPTQAGARIYRTGDLAAIGPDELAYFHGRSDSQIKSRGYRIELGEIEVALHTIDGVRDAAVVAVKSDGFDGTAICCAFAPGPGTGLTPVDIRASLSRLLPSYMVPSRWLELDVLPKNANGKIDRPALRRLFSEGRS